MLYVAEDAVVDGMNTKKEEVLTGKITLTIVMLYLDDSCATLASELEQQNTSNEKINPSGNGENISCATMTLSKNIVFLFFVNKYRHNAVLWMSIHTGAYLGLATLSNPLFVCQMFTCFHPSEGVSVADRFFRHTSPQRLTVSVLANLINEHP